MDFSKSHSNERPRLMADGDLVVIYIRHDALNHLYLKEGAFFNHKYGVFAHDDMIGKPFGSKINSRDNNQQRWLYILEPNPELWSGAVHTRTQIVNEVDSNFITLKLDVYPGCVVVESGTGSGCMTLNLARAVYPKGHVYTFEYNSIRAQKAKEEFDRFGVGNIVTVTCKDVCGKYEHEPLLEPMASISDLPPVGKGGFPGVPDDIADAVFLDLPEPWLALDHACRVLKDGGNICCYSPCIEQVMKTVEKLNELKFHSIRMMEVKQRPFDGRVIDLETIDLGIEDKDDEYINNQSIRDEISLQNINRFEKELHNNHKNDVQTSISANDDKMDSVQIPSEPNKKIKIEDNDASTSDGDPVHHQQVQLETYSSNGNELDTQLKKRSLHELKIDELDETKVIVDSKVPSQNPLKRLMNAPKSMVNGIYKMEIARPITTMKGHTAFLTFASYSR